MPIHVEKTKGQGAIGWISLFTLKQKPLHETFGEPTASLPDKTVMLPNEVETRCYVDNFRTVKVIDLSHVMVN